MIISLLSQPIRRAARPCANGAPTIAGRFSGALSNVCRKAADLQPQDADTARAFFEQNFQPVRIARLGEAEGLLTGYFEPIVAGSRFPSPEFSVPLYRRPRDLVAAGYKPGSLHFRTRACGSVAAPRTTSSCRTTTAAPSRPARSMGRNSKSAGSRVRPTCSRSRSCSDL